MSVLILEPEGYSPAAVELYEQLAPVHLATAPDPSNVEYLVVRLGHFIGRELLSGFPRLRLIATPTTGLNHIDTAYCDEIGLRVVSLRDCPSAITQVTSTSELAFGLLLALLRYIPAAARDVVESGRWDRDRFQARQVQGLRLGLVGFGRIARHVAGYGRAFGMHVRACDPHLDDAAFSDQQVERAELADLLAASDIVSIHAKHTPETDGLIGQAEIAQMRAGALLINTARGEILDEEAAALALRGGHLAGIAVDVLARENLVAGDLGRNPLVVAARDGFNVLVTPHIGGASRDAMHLTEKSLAAYIVNEVVHCG